MPLRITCTSASYDSDEVMYVNDSRPVRRALELRRENCEAFGDGHQDVEEVGALPEDEKLMTQDEFIEWIIADIGDGSHDDEAYAYIFEEN